MDEQQRDYPKDVSFQDADKIYSRLLAIADDLKKELDKYGPPMSTKAFNAFWSKMIAIESTANQLYIASHTGMEPKK